MATTASNHARSPAAACCWTLLPLLLVVECWGCGPSPAQLRRGESVATPRGRGTPIAERGPDTPAAPQEPDAAAPAPSAPSAPAQPKVSGQGASAAATGPYRVQLSPPAKVGDRYRMQVSATLRQVFATQVAGQDRRVDTTNRLDVDAVGEVLEVNGRGQVLRAAFVIKRCVGVGAKGERELLAEGATLTVRRTGPKPRMSADSGPISKADQRWLRMVFSTRTPTFSDQEMFGASGPRLVGDAWTIDTDKTADLLKASGAIIDPADISGTTTLVAAKPCATTTCLTTTTTLSGANVRLNNVPPTATLLDSGMQGTSRRVLPLAVNKAPTLTDDTFVLHVTVAVQKADDEIEIEVRIESRERGVWTPLP